MMERIINDLFIISDEEKVVDGIARITGKIPDMDSIVDNIVSNPKAVFFLDKDLKVVDINDKDVKVAWLDTGTKTLTGAPVMISLVHHDKYFEGYFTGAPYYLVNGMCNRVPIKGRVYKENLRRFNKKYCRINAIQFNGNEDDIKKRDGSETFQLKHTDGLTNVTEAIYDNLLFPQWKSIEGLDRFIKIIGCRLKQLIDQGDEAYYVKNKTLSAIVNTGMMNLFGTDIYVLYRYYEKHKSYIAENVISGKGDFIKYGFSKEQAMKTIEPISFGKERFQPAPEDFDINQNCLIHIINERRSRFPENIQSQPDEKIASHIRINLERGIKMQQRDSSFAKPTYSAKTGTISWLLPLHIDSAIGEKPELVMAIRKVGDFYEVKTIMTFDDEIEDRITALSLYSNIWNA